MRDFLLEVIALTQKTPATALVVLPDILAFQKLWNELESVKLKWFVKPPMVENYANGSKIFVLEKRGSITNLRGYNATYGYIENGTPEQIQILRDRLGREGQSGFLITKNREVLSLAFI